MTLSITKLFHYAECHCAECRDLFIGMLNAIMLSVNMLSIIRVNVVRLSVVAPILPENIRQGWRRLVVCYLKLWIGAQELGAL